MTDAIGWALLFNGSMISAVYTMYDYYFGGWLIALLFFVYQAMLYMKTRSLTLVFIMGALFASLYVGSIFVKNMSAQFIFLILVIELAGIIYFWLWR